MHDSWIYFFPAYTYRVASHLPSLILDSLLNIPHFLISIRNRILPVDPFFRRAPDLPLPPPVTPRTVTTANNREGHDESSETSSETDAESNASESVDSWISLHDGGQGSEDHARDE